MKRFAKSMNGDVHLIASLSGGEYTMCGNPFESIFSKELSWVDMPGNPVVTCRHCITEILNCRNVRLDKEIVAERIRKGDKS